MSSGHHVDPAPVGTVIRTLQHNPGLLPFLGGRPIVDRRYRVPYLAGRSIDGLVTYVDANTPMRLPKSGVDADEFYADHEGFEWWMMTRRGMPYDRAHPLAHGYEQMRMRLAGHPDEQIEAYEKESRALVDADEHAKLPPEAFPPDLYLGPYESDPDALDWRLLTLLRAARHANRTIGHG